MTVSQEPQFAYYYPSPWWTDDSFIKSLILFFDGVAFLVPDYMQDRLFRSDPAIAIGLRDNGLIKILTPELEVDKDKAEKLAEAMTNVIASGALDHLAKDSQPFAQLSYSRLGGFGDEGLAEMVYEELKERGLAEPSRDGASIPMHPFVRTLVLVLLAQIMRPVGSKHGVVLQPTTDQPRIVNALMDFLELPNLPSAGNVISLDVQEVAIDLSAVPIDDVLEFREEHGLEYRRYAREVKRLVRELGPLDAEQRDEALRDRREAIDDAAEDLRARAKKRWRRRASFFGFSGAGAVWTASVGDPLAAVLNLGSNIVGAPEGSSSEVGAFTYLMAVRERFRS